MQVLRLGIVDKNARPFGISEWLQPFHRAMSTDLKRLNQFRDEPNNIWRPFKNVDGNSVSELQAFLKQAGFFPKAQVSGIFGYGTRAALRLFQEYLRNKEGHAEVVPDGVLGSISAAHIERWKKDGLRSRWSDFSISNPGPEYQKWFELLKRAQLKYLSSNDPVIHNLRSSTKKSDSLPPEKWTFRPFDSHLIGIRCQAEVAFDNRPNDDLFILLLNGMVFTFWGSTDPNPKLVSNKIKQKAGSPFLTEGQHRYRFGWHKVSSKSRVYMALRPYSKGVMVYRDRKNRNKLMMDDIQRGFDKPNSTINIHWTPDGDRNWSAGCQVISGESYIDNDDSLISCRDYCANHYNELSGSKTRGAYNVLSDLVVSYAALGNDVVWYTLARIENFAEVAPEFGVEFINGELKRLRSNQ